MILARCNAYKAVSIWRHTGCFTKCLVIRTHRWSYIIYQGCSPSKNTCAHEWSLTLFSPRIKTLLGERLSASSNSALIQDLENLQVTSLCNIAIGFLVIVFTFQNRSSCGIMTLWLERCSSRCLARGFHALYATKSQESEADRISGISTKDRVHDSQVLRTDEFCLPKR